MKIIVTGGTGFIGSRLTDLLLNEGHKVVVLTRHPERYDRPTAVHYEGWDGKSLESWRAHLEESDGVINLAGESIAEGRWTAERKKRILDSRISATKALVLAMKQAAVKPKVFISASAVGYYGNVSAGDVTEEFPKGEGFLADVCAQWEAEALEAQSAGIRAAIPRIGVVLGEGGGALEKMKLPFKLFAGGPLGTGRQWLPWVHREDVIGMILFALHNSQVSGAFNATAPQPVVMKDFCRVLGGVMHRPSWSPAPAFALRLLLGEMAEMLLTGQRAVPQKIERWGYSFHFPELKAALSSILGK